MCMMLEKPAFYSLPAHYVTDLWENNSDGFGAYNYETREVYKTLSQSECEQYLLDNHNCRLFIHFRMSTGGYITLDNIHPFKINDNMILFHNGILSSILADGDKSDTSVMCSFFDAFKGDDKELLEGVTQYLEDNEKGSRFTIINTATNATHIPNCAKWCTHITTGGDEITFSNSYAISYHLLYNLPKGSYSRNNYGFGSRYDAWQEYEDMAINTQTLQEMLEDKSTIRSLVDFIQDNPECVAHFLRDYYDPTLHDVVETEYTQDMEILDYDHLGIKEANYDFKTGKALTYKKRA